MEQVLFTILTDKQARKSDAQFNTTKQPDDDMITAGAPWLSKEVDDKMVAFYKNIFSSREKANTSQIERTD